MLQEVFIITIRLFLLITLIGFSKLYSQDNFRLSCDFSIKEKNISSNQSKLTIGKVFYDINANQIVYDITFPEKEILVVTDSTIYRIKDNKIVDKAISFNINQFSVFYLSLAHQLDDFGLKKTGYELVEIEKENDLIISTWSPPKKYKEFKGDIVLSKRNEKLYGIVSMTPDVKVIGKQIFSDYYSERGVLFPQKVTQLMELGEKTIKETNYKNIKINELDNEDFYFVNISKYR